MATTIMTCPSCGGELTELDRSGVRIDACRSCRGVWLDRGELDKIIERNERSIRPYEDDDRSRSNNQQQPKKKKKFGMANCW